MALLVGDKTALVVTWAQLDGASFTRSEVLAMTTLAVYVTALALAATSSFVRRDILGAS